MFATRYPIRVGLLGVIGPDGHCTILGRRRKLRMDSATAQLEARCWVGMVLDLGIDLDAVYGRKNDDLVHRAYQT